MWEGRERSPVLAAPGSNSYAGLIAGSTNAKSGSDDEEFQGPFNPHALCANYERLAYKIARTYRGKGIELQDLESAGLTGLVLASRKFNPDLGFAFGGYARYWITGEITALFKGKDALDRAKSLTIWDKDGRHFQKDVADEPPVIAPDFGALSENDRLIVEARDNGETLREIGKRLGISAERVRQKEARARKQIKGSNASLCLSDLTQRGDAPKAPQYLCTA